MKLLSFGEIIWDVYPNEKFIGGAPFNFAVHAKRAGADAYLVSAVGDDDLGREALKWVNYYGVNAEFINVSQYPTGQCLVSLDEKGVPHYDIIENTAYDDILCSETAERFDVLAFGTLALRGENNRNVLKCLVKSGDFKEIFVDLNIRQPFGFKESIELALETATVLKISDEELPYVASVTFGRFIDVKDSIQRITLKYPQIKLVIITCGSKPATVYNTVNNREYTCESLKVQVVSTVGAGDSYGAAFLTHYMNGKDILECMREAAKVSAFVVSNIGAIPE